MSLADIGTQPLSQTRPTYAAGNYTRINTATTTLVKTGAGALLGFYVASTTSGTLVFYDNTSAAAPQISGTITPNVGWNPLPAVFKTGCTVVSAGTIDCTVVYL